MPVTYTTTASDVSSVDSASALVAGVVFDWDASTITVPATVAQIDGQWMVDHARFAENTLKGVARKDISQATGKVQIGTDATTSQPILTGVLAVLQDSWKIVTLRNTGQEFTIRDIYKADGSLPYDNTVDADVIYTRTVNPTVVFVSVEGSTFTLDELWGYSNRTLTDDTDRVKEIHRFRHLDASNPITTDKTGDTTTETDGSVTITHVVDTGTETVVSTRTG